MKKVNGIRVLVAVCLMKMLCVGFSGVAADHTDHMLAPVDTAPSPPSPPPSSEECEGSVEVLACPGLGLEDSNDEEEEEAFFGAFSV